MSNLYKELASYEERDAKIFKGRDSEIREMYENFINNEYLVCYADSGEGKSSIIEAGLIPILRENFFFPIRIVFKDKQFKKNNIDFDKYVCQAITDEVGKFKEDSSIRVDTIYSKRLTSDKSSEMAEWEKQMIDSYVWLKLRYAQLTIDNFVFTPVLIFDQFEEVFTNPQSQEWTDNLFAWLQELTMDLCPKVIVNDLENKLGTENFPQIATQKHFKAIFSLRSEYIGQLDYWGMQKHYIPQLKNNRYLLRPLTIAGAKEVITQQEGFTGLNDVAEDIVDILRNLQKGKNCVLSKDSQLPCIPALFLSVVCSQAYSLPKQELADFIHKLREEGEKTVEKLIGQFYEKAVQGCDISEKDLEIIEELLVNNTGIRQRISSQSDMLREIGFSKNYMEKLKGARLIRVIPEYNRPEESVELIHDCLCSVIKEKKEKRFQIKKEEAEIAKKNIQRLKGQREDYIASTYLFFLSVFIIWFLSTIYCDKVTAESIGAFDTIVIFSLGNFAVLPFIIYGTVKRLKITSWLSVYGLLSNIVLICLFIIGQDKEMTLRTVYGIVVIGIPLVALIYSLRFKMFGLPKKKEFSILLKSIPLLSFYGIVSAFMFCLCVFNTAFGLPEPFNSFWGVVVIPILSHEIIRNGFKLSQEKVNFCIIMVLLCLLAYNTWDYFFAFSSIVLITILVGVIAAVVWSFRKLIYGKRIVAIVLESVVIIAVLVLNLGFNPLLVKYDNVAHVFNWISVDVNSQNGKFGIITACKGDTIIPCLIDSIDNRKHYYHVISSKLHYEEDVSDTKELYTYEKETGTSHYSGMFLDNVELYIWKYANRSEMDSTLQDSLSVYAARTYHEIRNANIGYLLSGKMYSAKDIRSLDTLIVLQDKEMFSVLNDLESISSENKPIDYSQVVSFGKEFARTFYLCMLKDRIQERDSVNLFTMAQEFVSLYFYDAPNYELSVHVQQPMTIGNIQKIYRSSFKVSDLRKSVLDPNVLDSWYNYVNMLLGSDISINVIRYAKIKEKQYDAFSKNYAKLSGDLKKRRDDSLNRTRASSSMDGIEKVRYLIESMKKNDESIDSAKLGLNRLIDNIEIEKRDMDLVFRKLINDVFMTLTNVVINSKTIYDSAFIDLCEQLWLVSKVRQYELSSTYLQCIESMNNAKNEGYILLKKIEEQESQIKKLLGDI